MSSSRTDHRRRAHHGLLGLAPGDLATPDRFDECDIPGNDAMAAELPGSNRRDVVSRRAAGVGDRPANTHCMNALLTDSERPTSWDDILPYTLMEGKTTALSSRVPPATLK